MHKKVFFVFTLLIFITISLFSLVYIFAKDKNDKRPNVILITFDALRADHLGCYGYPLKITPNIDKIAKKSTVFTQAFAQANSTFPSLTSIFTSLYPCVHRNCFFVQDLKYLCPLIVTALQDNGYYTSFFSDHLNLKPLKDLFKGFDTFQISANNAELRKSVFNFLAKNNKKNSFFISITLIPTSPIPHRNFIKK